MRRLLDRLRPGAGDRDDGRRARAPCRGLLTATFAGRQVAISCSGSDEVPGRDSRFNAQYRTCQLVEGRQDLTAYTARR